MSVRNEQSGQSQLLIVVALISFKYEQKTEKNDCLWPQWTSGLKKSNEQLNFADCPLWPGSPASVICNFLCSESNVIIPWSVSNGWSYDRDLIGLNKVLDSSSSCYKVLCSETCDKRSDRMSLLERLVIRGPIMSLSERLMIWVHSRPCVQC